LEQHLSERHPNSPLKEVIFEIRFPAETSIEGRRYDIQDKLRRDYPNLLLPVIPDGESPALVPYRFEKEDQTAGVMIAVNRFAYYCRNYLGYNSFRIECLKLAHTFFQTYNIQVINRVGLRHINIIPFVRESGLIPLDQIFVIGEKLKEIFVYGFQNLALVFASPVTNGLITTRIDQILKEDGGQEAFLLDFDYGRTSSLDIPAIDKLLDEAHEQSVKIFTKIITASYHNFIEGMDEEQ
jgi:uncharacterized protein (TIGR04255 family)